MTKLTLKEYDYDERVTKVVGEVSAFTLINSMNTEFLAELIDDWLNRFNDERNGMAIGKILSNSHPTLQASALRWAIGIILGLAEKEHTDLRNEASVKAAKQIKQLVESGEIKIGYMI